ncbi:hypothetical protein H4582DRAFT_2062364 [Lactarius indigo]|nr:hypothetical protein H4582DRAFT_2062364 [Lactarius indigo]
MPPKNTFTIPMGDVVEVVNQTRKTKWGLRTTVKEVPFHLKKGKSGQASMSQTGVEDHYGDKPYEPDLQDFQAEESQPQQSTPMSQWTDMRSRYIHLFARDGGSDKCSKLLYVYQFNADQVLQVYWRKGHQVSDGTQRRKRTSHQTRSASLVSVEEEQAHSSGGSAAFVSLIWMYSSAYAPTLVPMMSNYSKLEYFLQPSSRLRLHSPSQFWMTSWLTTWSGKTTAQQYYSKLQSITNRMFPDQSRHIEPLQTALEGIPTMEGLEE